MNRLTKTILISAMLLAGIAALALSQEASKEAATASVAIDQPAPDFALKDIDGKEHKLIGLQGKVRCPRVGQL